MDSSLMPRARVRSAEVGGANVSTQVWARGAAAAARGRGGRQLTTLASFGRRWDLGAARGGAESQRTAAVVLEAVRSQEEGHQGDVGGVHRLEREAVVGAVEVGIGDEILDGLEHLLQEGTLDKTGLKHGDLCLLVYYVDTSV